MRCTEIRPRGGEGEEECKQSSPRGGREGVRGERHLGRTRERGERSVRGGEERRPASRQGQGGRGGL